MSKNESLESLFKKAMEEIEASGREIRIKDYYYAMARVETLKMDIENYYAGEFSYCNGGISYDEDIKKAYADGYKIGLYFFQYTQELNHKGQMLPHYYEKYPDATYISAKCFLRKYGLRYPEFMTFGQGGLKFETEEEVEGDYQEYNNKVMQMIASGLINETEKDLLLLTGEYFHRRNKIDLENRNNLEDSARLTRKN